MKHILTYILILLFTANAFGQQWVIPKAGEVMAKEQVISPKVDSYKSGIRKARAITANDRVAVGRYGLFMKTSNAGVNCSSTIIPLFPLFTIQGNAKYADNNQPVTSGSVKVIKLDRITGNIIVLDSTLIQPNGDYSLIHVPQDSVYIGIYPNSTPTTDFVFGYYPSSIYWANSTRLYPTGNLNNINILALRMFGTNSNNSISGKVTKLTANGLKDAVVYAKNGNTFVRYTTTDINGVYHLQSLPTGNLEIIVDRLGFSSDSTNVIVTSTSNIDSINFNLYEKPIGIKQISNVVPSEYKLFQNYPNPFNPSTIIRFEIAENGKWKTENGLVKLNVFDITGRVIVTLINGNLQTGTYEVTFDGSGLASGIYFYKLSAIDFKETKKMILIK